MLRKLKVTLILVVFVLLLTGLTICGGSGEKFNPTSSLTLDAGVHYYSKFIVPQDVIVTLSGDVVLEVDGSVEIEGSITGYCVRVEIRSSKSLILDGRLAVNCTT